MTKAWDDHREVIIGLYKEQNRPLHEVQRIMEERHNFRASTRAYRSRLDKWTVHKYSCRRRRNTGTANEMPSSASDNPAGLSPPPTPDPQEREGSPREHSVSPGVSMSPMSPQYFAHSLGGTTPPSDLGSPLSPSIADSRGQYDQNVMNCPPPLRHPMAFARGGFGQSPDPQFRYTTYGHPHQSQQQYDAQADYYRSNNQERLYHHSSSRSGSGAGFAASPSPPSSTDQSGYTHHNRGHSMAYGGSYSSGPNGAQGQPE
ncbi:Clr5 domain-containing protein [Lasiosphaeris hirsuta]|uniref:Clr5 domain-containing protein n=1 Tax=Lasiosphaeris hirsuta TaxID=260670 RepID=A0AA40A1K6_9PEZI|nr:Clr5 domain-containing protein [Lasiosphaeris hirsuta]